MTTTARTGASIAAAAAALALGGSLAAAQSPGPSARAPDLIHCYGVNGCKGTSDCKSYNHQCKGQNDCAGRGFKIETQKACTAQGGRLTE
jgi:uncharacterized membrane protein